MRWRAIAHPILLVGYYGMCGWQRWRLRVRRGRTRTKPEEDQPNHCQGCKSQLHLSSCDEGYGTLHPSGATGEPYERR